MTEEVHTLPEGFKDEIRAFHLVCNRAAVLTLQHHCDASVRPDPSRFFVDASLSPCHGVSVPLASWVVDVRATLLDEPTAPFFSLQLSPKRVDFYMIDASPYGDLTLQRFTATPHALVFVGSSYCVPRRLDDVRLPLWSSATLDTDARVCVERHLRAGIAEVDFIDLTWLPRHLLRPRILVAMPGAVADGGAKRRELLEIMEAYGVSADVCAQALADAEAAERAA